MGNIFLYCPFSGENADYAMCWVCCVYLLVWPWPNTFMSLPPQYSAGLLQKSSDMCFLFIACAVESHNFPDPSRLGTLTLATGSWISRGGRSRLRTESYSLLSTIVTLSLITYGPMQCPCHPEPLTQTLPLLMATVHSSHPVALLFSASFWWWHSWLEPAAPPARSTLLLQDQLHFPP